MKNTFRTIHLYLALAASLFIIISCVTGTIMVFDEEIEHAQHPERYQVTPAGNRLTADELIKRAAATTPGAKPGSLKVYNKASASAEVGISLPEQPVAGGESKPAKAEKPAEGKPRGGINLNVYVNPYTGKILDVYNVRKSFFKNVEMVHRFLSGGKGSVGNYIMNFSTVFFFFIILTGIILWWPKTVNILKQRLLIKFNASRKRLNHDLHIVGGFYTSIFLIIITSTGLIMAFGWINQQIFTFTGSKMESPPPPSSVFQANTTPVSAQQALTSAMAAFPEAEYYFLRFPKDSVGAVSLSVLPKGAFENEIDMYFLDQYSGKFIGSQKFDDKNLGQKIRSYVKPVHTGSIYGLPTKILSFVVCLLSISFPVTGIIMWLNRTRKRKPAL